MDKANLRLSEKEAELVANADWILTKNGIIEKVKFIFGDLLSRQQGYVIREGGILPAEVMAIQGKISRGENYRGLPYLILDYPRFFGKDDHFAVRSMFWWGHFFSITLHLSGKYKSLYQTRIETAFESLKDESFFLSIHDEQWEHHFGRTNYIPLTEMNDDLFKLRTRDKDFIKLAKKIPLDQWNDAEDILFESFCKLIGRLAG